MPLCSGSNGEAFEEEEGMVSVSVTSGCKDGEDDDEQLFIWAITC